MQPNVVIVGGGPAGLATAACLARLSIPYTILERDESLASFWTKRSYDRLGLHLAKEYCTLPFMEYPANTPTFMDKHSFINYLQDYVRRFEITVRCCVSVETATYDGFLRKWRVGAVNTSTKEVEVFLADFLVVATGENDERVWGRVYGLESFKGEVSHSGDYKTGLRYRDKKVLVVGCGNSGMEISCDLSCSGAEEVWIVVRSPFHVVSKRMVQLGMKLLKYIPVWAVDNLITLLANFKYGDLSEFGIHRPRAGPFFLKATTGRSPVIDVGTIQKIRSRQIKVMPAISKIDGSNVIFENETEKKFDAIILATGFRSSATRWLKDYGYVFNEKGLPKKKYPDHWKGEKGLYCAGFSSRGLAGISYDAKSIAQDINSKLTAQSNN